MRQICVNVSAMVRQRDSGRPRGRPLGPDSLTWRYFGDRRMVLLGPRAAVLQNMLPALGQGVEDHSVWFAETLARLERSIPPIYDTVFGADPDASGHEVRDFHRTIKGRLPDGSPYSALNPDTYYWAHACFVEHLITATDTFIRRLSRREGAALRRVDDVVRALRRQFARDAADLRRVRRLLRRRPRATAGGPPDGVVRRRLRDQGLAPPAPVPRPVWWIVRRPVNAISSSLTIGGMPPRGREILGLPWDAARERRYQRFARQPRPERRLPPPARPLAPAPHPAPRLRARGPPGLSRARAARFSTSTRSRSPAGVKPQTCPRKSSSSSAARTIAAGSRNP